MILARSQSLFCAGFRGPKGASRRLIRAKARRSVSNGITQDRHLDQIKRKRVVILPKMTGFHKLPRN